MHQQSFLCPDGKQKVQGRNTPSLVRKTSRIALLYCDQLSANDATTNAPALPGGLSELQSWDNWTSLREWPGVVMLHHSFSCIENALCYSNDGTAKNCVKAADGNSGPKCGASQVAMCCDAFLTHDNCLTASGSSCASYGLSNGVTPLSPFCCDQPDYPSCGRASNATFCQGM
ncbi:hypothetical protein MMC14_010679, partial [Varicellaria rhodocarpa]|nr:hypothetical protein [Varicellaria rhodocarpa]